MGGEGDETTASGGWESLAIGERPSSEKEKAIGWKADLMPCTEHLRDPKKKGSDADL